MKIKFELEIEKIEMNISISTKTEKTTLADETLLKGCSKALNDLAEYLVIICKETEYARHTSINHTNP